MKRLAAFLVLALLAVSVPVEAHAGWGFLKTLKLWDRKAPTALVIFNASYEYPVAVCVKTWQGYRFVKMLQPRTSTWVTLADIIGAASNALPRHHVEKVEVLYAYDMEGVHISGHLEQLVPLAKGSYIKTHLVEIGESE